VKRNRLQRGSTLKPQLLVRLIFMKCRLWYNSTDSFPLVVCSFLQIGSGFCSRLNWLWLSCSTLQALHSREEAASRLHRGFTAATVTSDTSLKTFTETSFWATWRSGSSGFLWLDN